MDGVSFSPLASVTANITTYSDTGLSAATAYSYRVRAFNAGGSSVYSNTSGATTLLFTPSSPSALKAIAVSSNRINLSWTDNAANETGFKIERSLDGVNFTVIATTAANVSTFADTRSTTYTQYTYRVSAYNAAGSSGYSNTASSALLQLHADASEVSGVTNGSVVTPSVGSTGFKGTLVAKGTGSVNYAPGQLGSAVYLSRRQ